MHVIVLMGLVSIEKGDLAIALAEHYTAQGKRVVVVDNLRRVGIDPEQLSAATYHAVRGELAAALPTLPAADVMIIATAEDAEPEALYIALQDWGAQQPHISLETVALIDLRTCDCFPHMRALLEQLADTTLYAPFHLQDLFAEPGAPTETGAKPQPR
ncbi:MAG: hypothetical protein D6712_09320 [Chloroflexi bacterium]|nr:MAG: hypothetical protein D6712_09320 [Chloroflexota bacterium]